MAEPNTSAPVLRVEHLSTCFFTPAGLVRAVDDLSFTIGHGETLAIVGESGCGKSVTALSLMRLVPYPPGRIVGGSVLLGTKNLVDADEAEMRAVRGNRISMIFQEPMTSLNPVKPIGRQVSEALRLHQNLSRGAAMTRAIEMLDIVRIPEATRRARDYPHQLSGGMRQRVMIAMALACKPELLIADEPTTALDVTIQAQIMTLIAELQQSLGTAVLLITHDLGVVAESAHRVIVMYAGRKIEEASVAELFARPLHPYTRGLIGSVPRLPVAGAPEAAPHRLAEIPGMVPPMTRLPAGCAFAPRCSMAVDKCRAERPPLVEHAPAHTAACWRAGEAGDNGASAIQAALLASGSVKTA